MPDSEVNTPSFPTQSTQLTLCSPPSSRPPGQIHPAMLFSDAAPLWLETRRGRIAPQTFRDYGIYVATLSDFFGGILLRDINGDRIREYQALRARTVRSTAINHESSALQQILKRARLWESIREDYRPMPMPKESRGRALSSEEYERLFRTAASDRNWEAAYLFAVIAVNTTAGPKEVRTLRLADVNLEARTISICEGGAKNAYRIRAIPLNEAAYDAVLRAMSRARLQGSSRAEHYLFPFRIKRGTYDPTKPQTSFKGAWRALCEAANLKGFRMYDLRHHAITALLENPEVSEETAEAIAGHISRQMQRHYSHIRMEYKRQAVEALLRKGRKREVRLLPAVKKSAERVTAENAPDDASWLRLVGEE